MIVNIKSKGKYKRRRRYQYMRVEMNWSATIQCFNIEDFETAKYWLEANGVFYINTHMQIVAVFQNADDAALFKLSFADELSG